MITIGNSIVEATMSKRSRFFEYLPYRHITRNYWKNDKNMEWIACPKPSMDDDMYDETFWDQPHDERYRRMHSYDFCVTEKEPVFDAADISRVGRDIFVQKSMTTNNGGIEWLRRTFEPKGMRVNPVHFPYDLHPSHIDCTFVPLRPPTKGSDGIVLVNPERPPLKSQAQLWLQNGWRFLTVAMPASDRRPAFSQSSKWLSMNLLSLSERCLVIEENEVPLYNLLEDNDFDVLTIPFRHAYEFGGALHCTTWDIKRDDSCVDYFPIRDIEVDRRHQNLAVFNDVDTMTLPPCGGLTDPSLTTPITKLNEYIPVQKSVVKDCLIQSGYDIWTDPAQINDDHEEISDQPLMERWEKPYMEALADEAVGNGGVVLEVGFGLGLAAHRIQRHDNVTEHIIIESNPSVAQSLKAFAREHSNVTPKIGKWQEVIKTLPKHSVDRIFYNAYADNKTELHIHQFLFAKEAWEILKPGGTFVYCNLSSTDELKNRFATWQELFQETQHPHLYVVGFRAADIKVFPFSPMTIKQRGHCEYFQHESAMIAKAVKPE
eukprot:NODE_565_length_2312_cov_275.687072_g537_i0.p1 GENE.NODE_565_length_2312_cov_275.687072_g537_i0~~NODE_565_length_2312_cov_275.687072_g537_i0.p1  ORF type:complete len:545 (+),score=107.37 NODE_565_length_2312_cov_275.687072_g537_i0:473-2107(+)